MESYTEIVDRLAKKYNYTPFMYVDYPHKSYWSNKFGDEDVRDALNQLFVQKKDVPTMLYLHMPYCHTQCYFCTCHVLITDDYQDVKNYLQLLYKEIDLLAEYFKANNCRPYIEEIHFGGGSPTYMRQEEFDQLIEKLKTICDFSKINEMAIEVDPRRVKVEHLRYYHSKGINRLSFGVQDFDPTVQQAVNRVQPAELTERLLIPEIRQLFKNGINFDIICGLPHQTLESIEKTFQKIIELNPDRICLNYMDFAPNFHQHQLLMPQKAFPNIKQKKELFKKALKILQDSDYVRTGYDHFARPDDDNAKAMREKKMHWNPLGYTPGRCVDLLAIGVSGSSRIGNYYYQNTYDVSSYRTFLNAKKFPVFRGTRLSDDDIMRRDIILNLRSYFSLDMKEIENKYKINFQDYFKDEMERLKILISDGIAELKDQTIVITGPGHEFVNVVCENFDKYLDDTRATRRDDEMIQLNK